VLEGQTAEAAVWHKLTAVLGSYYPTQSGAALPIGRFAIDSGYATPEVYAWARKYGGVRAVVSRGGMPHEPVQRIRQTNYRVDRGGDWRYRFAATQATGVSSASR
jgi:phage terminase large subunit GpA-like protein